MSTSMERKTASQAALNQNKAKLHSIIKIKHGFKSHAQIS